MTTKEFRSVIMTASHSELDEIVSMIKLRRSHLQEITGQKFAVGDQVRFDARTRGMVIGKITKINRKTVKVMSNKGVLWTVTPSFLEAV